SSASSSGCTARNSSRALASAWPAYVASSLVTADASGPRANRTRAQLFIFHCRRRGLPTAIEPLMARVIERNSVGAFETEAAGGIRCLPHFRGGRQDGIFKME